VLVPLAIAVALSCGWAAWLLKSATALAWMRVFVFVAVLLIAAVSAYCLWNVNDLTMRASRATPADRQRLLSEGLMHGYRVLAIGYALGILSIGVITAMHIRHRRSRH
jgi:hypothetical protein